MTRFSMFFIAIGAFIAVSCTTQPTPPATPASTSAAASVTAADLEQAGHWSENLYDRAAASDWAGAASDVESLQLALDRLQTRFGGNEHLTAAKNDLARIRSAVTARDARALSRLSNGVTRDVALLGASTNPAVPAEVTLLDYYGRELAIWSADGNVDRLRSTRSEASETWRRLEPRLIARGASAERDRFGALMKRLDDARSVDDFRVLATPILDEVDNLERAFTK